jgi:hypothetical protein
MNIQRENIQGDGFVIPSVVIIPPNPMGGIRYYSWVWRLQGRTIRIGLASRQGRINGMHD